jgi:hypothetical protein
MCEIILKKYNSSEEPITIMTRIEHLDKIDNY